MIETPLGHLNLQCAIDELSLPSVADVAIASARARVLIWERGAVRAELLLAEVDPVLPVGLHVDRVVGALWRVRADTSCASLRFECRGDLDRVPSPASGQALEATVWESGGTEVTVGTADGEGLAALFRSADVLPRRWRDRFEVVSPEDAPLATYLPDGLRIELPGLEPGETGEVHFAIAWGPSSDGTAGWFAVDILPSRILEAGARAV